MNYKLAYETEVKKLQKAKELIKFYEDHADLRGVSIEEWNKGKDLSNQLSALESESGGEEDKVDCGGCGRCEKCLKFKAKFIYKKQQL